MKIPEKLEWISEEIAPGVKKCIVTGEQKLLEEIIDVLHEHEKSISNLELKINKDLSPKSDDNLEKFKSGRIEDNNSRNIDHDSKNNKILPDNSDVASVQQKAEVVANLDNNTTDWEDELENISAEGGISEEAYFRLEKSISKWLQQARIDTQKQMFSKKELTDLRLGLIYYFKIDKDSSVSKRMKDFYLKLDKLIESYQDRE